MKDTAETAETASFGYETVALDEKQGRVDRVFHRVASRYDVMNDLMSVGVHRLWKQAMVHWLNPPRLGRPYRVLDMAGGTGDIAFRIRDHSRGHAQVTVCDINESMLAVGRTRAERRRIEGLSFVLANAEDLSFEDRSFDAYTIAFGIRNVARRERALREAFRVLKRGGRFLCLEFSHVAVPGLDRLYDAYSMNAIPVIGKVVAGHEDAYRYLVESIRTFPDQERFAAMIGDAGFERVTWRNLSGGIAAIHSGWKI